jgi:hypothetical protein
MEQEGIRGMDEVLEGHMWVPERKTEGTMRFIYENCDGLSNNIGGNSKIDKVKELIDDLETDVIVHNKHKIHMCTSRIAMA